MEPHIQYTRANDGASLACCTIGEGEPLVYASNIYGDIHWYVNNDETRATVDAVVASGRRVIIYDGRGMGSSDREVTDFSCERRVQDLEAVVDYMALERFALCGFAQGGPVALLYSIQHPERVSHLALVNTFASGAAYYETIPAMRALIGLRTMAQEQWEFFTRTMGSAVTGFGDAAAAERTAALFRSGMAPAALLAFVEEAQKIDLVDVLPDVSTPTLVIAGTSGYVTAELVRPLATCIPRAQLVSTDDYAEELIVFLGGEPRERPAPAPPSGMTAILFTDIVDSTALTERMGDAAFRERARALDTSLREIITNNGGTVIDAKTLGDGVLATFPAASQAIDAALRCSAAGEAQSLALHLGLHAGDVIREQNNVFGGAVNIASRISGLSAPGEVLVSDVVRALARTSASVTFEDRGEHALKGVRDPQRVYAVRAPLPFREGAGG